MEYNINNIPSKSVKMLINLANRTNNHAYFTDVLQSTSINQFTTRLVKLTANVDCSRYEPGSDAEEGKRKVKGDMFELFTVLFLNAFGGDRTLFIHNVKWASRDQIGYDFLSENKDGDPCVIQSKFIANATVPFERDGRLETFFATLPEGVTVKKNRPSRVLFTTANITGGFYKSLERQDEGFKIIDRKLIKDFTDKNVGFWNYCNEVGRAYFKKSK